MIGPGDSHLRDSRSLEARQQDPPQAVADGGSKAAFEGFDRKIPVRVGADGLITHDTSGQFQPTPSDPHC